MSARRLFARVATLACVAALSGFSSTLYALDSASDEPAAMRLASDDRAFMKEAAAAGAYQVATSQLAEHQATSPGVKKLAARVMRDHSAANAQLQKLAVAKSYKLSVALSSAQQKSLASLSAASGQDFDRDYVRQVGIDRLKGDIKSFEFAARTSRDADLKAWAAKTLPMLQEHLAMAQSIRPGAN